MNAAQRRKSARKYYYRIKRRIGDALYSTDMQVDNNDWLIGAFLSRKAKKVYVFSVCTIAYAIFENLFDLSSDEFISTNTDWSKFKDFHLDFCKKQIEQNCIQSITEHFAETQQQYLKNHYSYIFISGELDLPTINECDIIQLINQFLNSEERGWVNSNPISYDSKYLMSKLCTQ